ncbi:MAG: hypothetical protein V4605_09520 [Pseudomonadota bacterium]
MGLLDNGEYQPMGGLLNDRLNDPLLQIGLGILANNNSKNFSEVIGRGALQGIQGVRQGKQLQYEKQYRDMQMKKFQQEQAKYEQEQKALADFDTKFPQYAGLAQLDPKSALKIAYPNLATNTADPYFTPISTSQGLGSFDNRSGKFIMMQGADGKPVIKSVDDPNLQGNISASKSYGENLYQPTDMQDGRITTKSQLAIDAGAPPVNMRPQPVPQLPQGSPVFPNQLQESMQIAPQVQQQRDAVRKQMLLAEQQQYGGQGANPSLDAEIANMGGQPARIAQAAGIKVPTKAEQAASTEVAKMQAETAAKAQINLPNVIQEGENTIKLVDDLLAAPGLKLAVGKSRLFGVQKIPGTEAYDFDNRLEQLKGKQFLQAYESLKGAGAITDIEGTKAGNAISRMNAATSEDEFVKASNEFKEVITQGVARAKLKAGNGAIMPQDEKMPKRNRADILKQYGVK